MSEVIYKNILVIYNPTAGTSSLKKLNSIIDGLKNLGTQVNMVATSYADHACDIAKQATKEEYDLIVAAGGDGTMNEVVNGVYPSKMPVAFIPLGTVNVLALEISLKNDVLSIVKYIAYGKVERCWLGCSNGRYFLLMMSVGHDAKSVAFVNRTLKTYFGKLAYLCSYLKSLIFSKNTIYQISIGDEKYSAFNVIVSNGRLYGGNFVCAPQASLNDDQLYISMAQKGSRLQALKYAALMFLGKYPNSATVKNIPANKCLIESEELNQPIQLDGDAIGELPAHVSITDDYINLLRP